jgi:hypothetical protein
MSRHEYVTRETIYHGQEWMLLTTQGWRTHTVEGRIAVMIRCLAHLGGGC